MAWPPWAAASLRGKPSASFLFFFFSKADSKATSLGSKGQGGMERSCAVNQVGRRTVPQTGWDQGRDRGEACRPTGANPTQPQEVVPAPPPGRQGWLGPCSAFGSGAQRHGSPQPHLPALSAF